MDGIPSRESSNASAPPAKDGADPEVVSARLLLKLLDKAAKAARTYGPINPVAKKFFEQFYDEISKHLTTYGLLAFLVQRTELYFKDQLVYQTDHDASRESIAFRMYGDGIRELAFYEGLTREDLSFFIEALWRSPDSEDAAQTDDDDIVTRLWAQDLHTISVVTAEEIAHSSGHGSDALDPQHADVLTASPSSLRDILDREKERPAASSSDDSSSATDAERSDSEAAEMTRQRLQPDLVGYEVSAEESAALTREIQEECRRDSIMYTLDILTAILASEQSVPLLTKLFDVWTSAVEALMRDGQWTMLESVLTLLQETDAVRPDLSHEHRQQVASLFQSLGHPERIKLIESHLNQNPEAPTEGLLTLLVSMKKEAVPSLCGLLANLESPAHQAIVVEALFIVARDHVEPLVRGLSDKRAVYVKNLLTVIGRWNDPRLAEAVERTLRHPDARIRKEVLKVLAALRPSGHGAKFVALLQDPDDTVRLIAMRVLINGHYAAPFHCWAPFVTKEDFHDRSPAEKRAVFHAMCRTAGDEAVPYWLDLLTGWAWTNRKKREDLALIAIEVLQKLATPAAAAALERGHKKGTPAVRQACAAALIAVTRQLNNAEPTAANS